ncbi:MAG: hypothetical protein JJ969_13850 [Rhizobiaceae bacterium]|nr:hypothetical protein [Rhizobiaceae bacterium]
MTNHELVRLSDAGSFPKVSLQEPNGRGYVLLAGEIDRRPPIGYFIESAAKKRLIADLKALLPALEALDAVEEATLFKALLIPPGRGAYLQKRPDVHIARYDLALLVRVASPDEAADIAASPELAAIEARLTEAAKHSYRMVGANLRRIGDVDHSRDGVFLINYFFAADETQNLAVWDYTAGWFMDQTGLDNSVLTRPLDQKGAQYTIVNHCRWDGLGDIVPSLLFKPSFRRYVLAHFEANDTAAIPILYRLA